MIFLEGQYYQSNIYYLTKHAVWQDKLTMFSMTINIQLQCNKLFIPFIGGIPPSYSDFLLRNPPSHSKILKNKS